ncbi:hypothetical protein I4F81_008170 [Pyropia yezoensis]|uniref:Uncharacterized protein n=1 Tax=Pyropia yezoensis TaxID=2788 RepID=A0ACC3C7D8_PYRYE|nr:hypothetical protein I4F81_008170 [Neopyropia yezoensis]
MHSFLDPEGPFAVPIGPPLSTPVLFRSDHMGDLSRKQPVIRVITHPPEEHPQGAVQVQLRCLRASWGVHFSAWRPEWPFPVVGRVNGVTVALAQAQRYTNGRLAGIDSATDLTPHLLPGVGSDNNVELVRSSSDAPPTPPATYVLFAQRVVVRSTDGMVAQVQAASAARLAALVAASVPADSPRPSVLDVCRAMVHRFLTAGEVTVGSIVLHLRCPLSLARIDVPVKGARCSHVQCFDLHSFLAYARRTGRFECPVCNERNALPSALRVCPFFEEALRLYPDEDEVVVHSDASIHRVAPQPPPLAVAGPVAPAAGGAVKTEGGAGGRLVNGGGMVVDLTGDSDAEESGAAAANGMGAAPMPAVEPLAPAPDAPPLAAEPPGMSPGAPPLPAEPPAVPPDAPPLPAEPPAVPPDAPPLAAEPLAVPPDAPAAAATTGADGTLAAPVAADSSAGAGAVGAAPTAAPMVSPPFHLLNGLVDWAGVPFEVTRTPETGRWLTDAMVDSDASDGE